MDSRKVIGITPAFDEGTKLPTAAASIYLRREYTKIMKQLGVVPLILTPEMPLEFIMEQCDGIVISGGEDIPPEFYGGDTLGTLQEPLERVMWEQLLIDACEAANKPVLGVCYGMQLIALHYGGSLVQDIANEVEDHVEHVGVLHEVMVSRDFLALKKGETYRVASRHHQAVKTLPDGFEMCASAPDGVIEAMQRGNIYGAQWHPESDATGIKLYGAFISRS